MCVVLTGGLSADGAQPVRTNQIPRQVPPQPWWTVRPVSTLLGGVLPFGCLFVQLYFLFSSLWCVRVCAMPCDGRRGDKLYYVFGFLALVVLIMCVTIAESTILLVYFQLCAENYHWWWQAVHAAGSIVAFFLAYAAYFYFRSGLAWSRRAASRCAAKWRSRAPSTRSFTSDTRPSLPSPSGSPRVGLRSMPRHSRPAAATGFWATFAFVRIIYSAVKVD